MKKITPGKLTAIFSTAFILSNTCLSTHAKANNREVDALKDYNAKKNTLYKGYLPIKNFLESRGLPLNIIQTLAPDVTIYIYIFPETEISSGGVVARAYPPKTKKSGDKCLLFLNAFEKEKDLQSLLIALTDDEEIKFKSNFNIKLKNVADFIFLHEIAHCNKNQFNMNSSHQREIEADYDAITTLVKVTGNTELIPFVTNLRALIINDLNHDTYLHIDARLNGNPEPSLEDVRQANIHVNKYLEGKMDIDQLPPLSLKRLDAYKKAVKYFIKEDKPLKFINRNTPSPLI